MGFIPVNISLIVFINEQTFPSIYMMFEHSLKKLLEKKIPVIYLSEEQNIIYYFMYYGSTKHAFVGHNTNRYLVIGIKSLVVSHKTTMNNHSSSVTWDTQYWNVNVNWF